MRYIAKVGDIKDHVRKDGTVDRRVKTETGWKYIGVHTKKHIYTQEEIDYVKENLSKIGLQGCSDYMGVKGTALSNMIKKWRKQGITIPIVKPCFELGTITIRSGGSWKGKKLMQKTENGWKYVKTTRKDNVESALKEPKANNRVLKYPIGAISKNGKRIKTENGWKVLNKETNSFYKVGDINSNGSRIKTEKGWAYIKVGYQNCGKHKKEVKTFLTSNGTYIKTNQGYKKVDTVKKKQEERSKTIVIKPTDTTGKQWVRVDRRTIVLRKIDLVK